MKLSATLLATLSALSGLAAQLERDIEVCGVDSVVLACDNPGPWKFATSAARMDDGTSELVLELDAPATAEVFDTYGETSGRSELPAGISRVKTPKGGYLVMKRK